MLAPSSIVATSRQHLGQLLRAAWEADRYVCDLNHIDVSGIRDFSHLFINMGFNGNLSEWDVSNGTNFEGMFENTPFTGDISRWNVSNGRNMQAMFRNSKFNGDISQWNVSNAVYITKMFEYSKFAQDISMWKLSPSLEAEDFKKFYDENPNFLTAQSVSPWTIKLHLANGTRPLDPEWADAFQKAFPLAQGLGLTFEEHAQAIVAMHADMQGHAPQIESVGGSLFESVA